MRKWTGCHALSRFVPVLVQEEVKSCAKNHDISGHFGSSSERSRSMEWCNVQPQQFTSLWFGSDFDSSTGTGTLSNSLIVFFFGSRTRYHSMHIVYPIPRWMCPNKLVNSIGSSHIDCCAAAYMPFLSNVFTKTYYIPIVSTLAAHFLLSFLFRFGFRIAVSRVYLPFAHVCLCAFHIYKCVCACCIYENMV